MNMDLDCTDRLRVYADEKYGEMAYIYSRGARVRVNVSYKSLAREVFNFARVSKFNDLESLDFICAYIEFKFGSKQAKTVRKDLEALST